MKEITKEYLLHLGRCKKLEEIESLDLSNHELTSIDADLFNNLKSLKTLDLSQNQLTCIPENLTLPELSVLDCAENCLKSITFAKNFKNLQELYFDDNENIHDESKFIAKVLCPHLQTINDCDSKFLDSAVSLYTSQLKPQVTAVWEAKYSEVYRKGVPTEELTSLYEEFIDSVASSSLIGKHLTMSRFRSFMIDRLCKELIISVNEGTYGSGKRTPAKPSRFRTGDSEAVTPVKNCSDTPMEVDEDTNQGQGRRTPNRGQGHSTASKGQGLNTPAKTPKRKRGESDDEGVDGTSLKVRKLEKGISPRKTPRNTPNSPRYTVLKQKFEHQEGYELSRVDDYDPKVFIRCHSKKDNPGDEQTKIWACAFEPRIDKEGETTNIVATCGGNQVCLFDCQTNKVLKRYKDFSKSESFYTLAWTTFEADNQNLREDVNILAVGGHDGEIKLIHPKQLVMFEVMEGHRSYISSLVFHPKDKQTLFSASRDSKIIIWNIGTPNFRKNTCDYKQIAVLGLPKTDAIGMVISPDLGMLVAGCENSCYAWELKKLSKTQKMIQPHYEFLHPLEDGEEKSSETAIDGLALLSDNCIVSKCIGHSCLYVWDLKQHKVKRNKPTMAVPVQPLTLLEYAQVTVDYVFLSAVKDLVCVGDDKGQVYMYDLQNVVKSKKKSDETLGPSRKIMYPVTGMDSKEPDSLRNSTEKEEVVINCVAVSSCREFLVYGTDNNLVAIWRKDSL